MNWAGVAIGILALGVLLAWDLVCYAWVDERVKRLETRVRALEPVDDSPGHEAEMYDDDSPEALLAEPHLSGLAGRAEDLADLLPGRSAGLRVPGLSGDLTAERGVEDLQGVQGVQLAPDVAEVVGQSIEDRGAQFVADRLLVPVAAHVVAEDVPQPAEGLSGAVVAGSLVVDGESADGHGVKDGLTSQVCQGGLDDDTDEFPVLPATVPDGLPLAVQTALIERPKGSDWVEQELEAMRARNAERMARRVQITKEAS